MTAPRLTLKTAEERELWRALYLKHDGPIADEGVRAYRERCATEPSDGAETEGPVIVRHFADRDERSLWLEPVKLGFAPAIAWEGVQAYRDACAPEPSDAWVPVSEWQAAETIALWVQAGEPKDENGAAHVGDIDLVRGSIKDLAHG